MCLNTSHLLKPDDYYVCFIIVGTTFITFLHNSSFYLDNPSKFEITYREVKRQNKIKTNAHIV